MTRARVVFLVLGLSAPLACAEAELTGKESQKPDGSSGGAAGTAGAAGTTSGGAAGNPSGGTAGADAAAGAGGASGGAAGGGGTTGTGGSSGGAGGASGGSGGATGGSGGASGGAGGVSGGAGGAGGATGGVGGAGGAGGATGGSGGVGGATGGVGGATGGTGGTAAASCTDSIKNGSETDVDCGGTCPKCASGKACGGNADCTSAACVTSKCAFVVQVDSSGNNTFTPAAVTIPVGGVVRWIWQKGGHTVTGGTGCNNYTGWCSPNDTNCASAPNSSQGATYDHTFTAAGTYPYYCRPHCSNMKGTVTVQ